MRLTRSPFPILACLAMFLSAAPHPPCRRAPVTAMARRKRSRHRHGRHGPHWLGRISDSLNPGNGVLSEAYTLYELVYDTPISVNSAGEYVPELATEWSSSEDGLTWTMTIRDDAVFQDGEPLTAEDVAFSMNLYKQTEDFPFLPSYVEPFTSIEATDETTVTLTTEDPIANFEPSMAFICLERLEDHPIEIAAPCPVVGVCRQLDPDALVRPLHERERYLIRSSPRFCRTQPDPRRPPRCWGEDVDERHRRLEVGDRVLGRERHGRVVRGLDARERLDIRGQEREGFGLLVEVHRECHVLRGGQWLAVLEDRVVANRHRPGQAVFGAGPLGGEARQRIRPPS